MLRIHIAGMAVALGPFRRQLCAWCGERLVDEDVRTIAVAPNPDGTPGDVDPMAWKMGELVAHDGPAWYTVPMPPDDQPLPRDCCTPVETRAVVGLTLVKGN